MMAERREKNIKDRFDIIYCKICRRNMLDREHKTLPCQHTYCYSCLKHSIHDQAIDCPACRRRTWVYEEKELQELPSDANLAKIKERERELIIYCGTLCQRCLLKGAKTRAISKCVQCFRTMCKSCKELHNSMPAFAGHIVDDIENEEKDSMMCTKHAQPVDYLCCHCIKGICVDCMFVDEHADHKDQIEEFATGIATLKSMITQVQGNVRDDIMDLADMKGRATEDMDRLATMTQGILDRRLQLQSQLDKECEYLLSVAHSSFREPTEYAVRSFEALHNDAVEALDSLGALLKKSDKDFLQKYQDVCGDVSSLRLATEMAIKNAYPMGEFMPADAKLEGMLGGLHLHEPRMTLQPASSELDMYMYVQESKLRFTLKNLDGKDFKRPVQFAFVDQQNIVLADLDYNFVTRIDREGNLVAKYYQKKGHGVNSLCIFGNYMYLAEPDGISVLPLSYSPGTTAAFYKPAVSNVGKIAVEDPSSIIITDREVGKILQYNPQKDHTIVVADGLKCPTYLCVTRTDKGCRYLVTERDLHRINIYDHKWRLLTSLGGQGKVDHQLQLPRGTAVTPSGHVLVADWGNHRVSQFHMDGRFDRLALTEKHGIQWPMALAYFYPDLWISEYNTSKKHAAVKCYHLPNL